GRHPASPASNPCVPGRLERLAVIGMGEPDERTRALAESLAVEIDDAVLGGDEVHVRARGDDAGARGELGDDAPAAALGARWQRDDGAPAGGERGAADEVHLTADTGDHARADRVGADLAGEVDLYGRVERDDVGVLADHAR